MLSKLFAILTKFHKLCGFYLNVILTNSNDWKSSLLTYLGEVVINLHIQ